MFSPVPPQGFYSRSEPVELIGDGLAQLVEFREQLLDTPKCNAESAGLEMNPCGQALHLVGNLLADGDFHGSGLKVSAVELGDDLFAPPLLVGELLAAGHLFELPDEFLA